MEKALKRTANEGSPEATKLTNLAFAIDKRIRKYRDSNVTNIDINELFPKTALMIAAGGTKNYVAELIKQNRDKSELTFLKELIKAKSLLEIVKKELIIWNQMVREIRKRYALSSVDYGYKPKDRKLGPR